MDMPVYISRRSFLLASGAVAALFSGLISSSAHAEPEVRGEAESAALARAQREYDAAQETLQAIGALLEETQHAKSETEYQLGILQGDIGVIQSDIAAKSRELEIAQAALAAYIQISYKSGAASILDVLLSSTDFNDFVTRSYYVAAVQDSQVETINDIKEIKAQLEIQESMLSEKETEQAQLLARLQEQEDSLSQQKAEADAVVAGLSVEVQQLFAAQQAELTAAAEARLRAANAALSGEQLGISMPGISQGSIVENAYACLGIPYEWGGDDTNFHIKGGFDCSGFAQHCYALEGYSIGRTTWDQIADIQIRGNWVDSLELLNPGDLVFPNDAHVGIYIGNGQMIDAPYPGMYIRIDPIETLLGGGSPV